MSTNVKPDPRSWNLTFCYEEIYPESGQVGRSYYWYDPNQRAPAIRDHDLRGLYPEIDAREWERLCHEAAQRGEAVFQAQLRAEAAGRLQHFIGDSAAADQFSASLSSTQIVLLLCAFEGRAPSSKR